MKRIVRGSDDPRRYERWGFDDPAPRAAPEPRKEPVLFPAHAEPIPPPAHDDPMPPPQRAPVMPRAPAPRPSNPAASPWRKIQIPDEERQRAALAGLHRYVGKSSDDETGARRAPLPIRARFATPRTETPPSAPIMPPETKTPPPEPVRDADAAQDTVPQAAPRPAAPRAAAPRAEAPRAMPPEKNPRLGLTVGIIVGLTLAAAVGLSWIAAPAIDAAPPQRADLLQRFAPQSQTQPGAPARPATPDPLIEVAPATPARPATATAVQPIEVAP